MQDVNCIQAAGASDEYKEDGSGTHLPKYILNWKSRKNIKHIFGSSEAESRSKQKRESQSGLVGASFMV